MMSVMDNNILGLALSFSFLALIILVGIILKRYASISSEAMCKFVHIGVSNWWFIEVQFFTSLSFAVTGPILFIILNSLFTFLDWGKSLGMDDKRRNYGLIYFPVTLLLLVILQYQGVVSTLVCSIAVFVMGYGDGLAALVGSKWGKKKLPVPGMIKSWAGTLTMASVSTLVALIGLGFFSALSFPAVLGISLVVGLVAAAAEALTPLGLDNITVPFSAVLILGVLL
jgi:phytol kinase